MEAEVQSARALLIARTTVVHASLALGLAMLLGGCLDERPPAPKTFPVATENDAAAQVRSFFDAYSSGDVDAAAQFLCDIGDQEREAVKAFISRSHAPSAPFRVDQVDIRSVASHWDDQEPTFWVEVAFPRSDGNGEVNSAYRVRVRTGCIENFVNAIPSARLADEAPSKRSDDNKEVPVRIPALPPPPSAVPTRVPTVPLAHDGGNRDVKRSPSAPPTSPHVE